MTTGLLTRPGIGDIELARIVDELTRRGFLTGIAGSVALLGLTACGSKGTVSTAPAPAPIRRVSTIHGDVELPASATRIVATDFPEVCTLLDLGIVPVGRTSYVPDFAAYTATLKDVPSIDEAQSGELLVEKIAALNPDLVVGDDWADPAKQRVPYDKLSKIAPTALFAWEQAAGNWPALATQTADAVNKTAELAVLKAKYAARASSIKTSDADLFARTRWDIIDCGQDSWDLYSKASSHGHVLTEAGVPLNAGKTQTSGYQQYSLERFDLLKSTDVIVTTTASLPYLDKLEAFTSLPAAKGGHVYATDLFFPASYGIALAFLDDLATICGKVAAS